MNTGCSSSAVVYSYRTICHIYKLKGNTDVIYDRYATCGPL
jgi:hypothetical protein